MAITRSTTYLSVNDGRAAIEWYGSVFGATVIEGELYDMPDGRVGHASLQIGGADIYLSDEFPDLGATSPTTAGASTAAVVMHTDRTEDVDELWQAATEAGASADRPPSDQMDFRSCWFTDPFGHRWSIMGPQAE